MKLEYVDDLESQLILLKEINKKLKHQQLKSVIEKSQQLESVCNNISKSQQYLSYKIITIISTILIVTYMTTVLIPISANNESSPMSTYYIVENVRGDTIGINTHLSVLDDSVSIRIDDKIGLEKSKIDSIKNSILSEEIVKLSGSVTHKTRSDSTSTYYIGWAGALKSLPETTKHQIPQSLTFSNNENAHIVIELVRYVTPDGYDGITRAVLSDDRQSIQKAHITIYGADKKSKSELETIVRHEFGHALGLKHSTDPDDLMYPTIVSAYPFISECDLEGLLFLYNGTFQEEYECKS